MIFVVLYLAGVSGSRRYRAGRAVSGQQLQFEEHI